jgi:hypothetical protein
MRRMQLLTGLFGGLMFWCMTGCSTHPLDSSAQLSPDDLAGMPNHRLCEAYTWERAPNLRGELQRRKIFTEQEWQAIDTGQVFMGMSEVALMVALPGISRTRASRSNGVVTNEWFFARLTALRVRTENGRVVSFE